MKQGNRYIKLFGWLAAATMLLTTSCKDDLFEGSNKLSDEVTVSFTLTPEAAATVATRSVKYPGEGEYPHISDGSKADVLIYAVYDEEDHVLDGYARGFVNDADNTLKNLFKDHDPELQTIVKIDEFPYTLNLTFKRGQKYKVAFWAQSSKTKAYDTRDLSKVEVIYSEINTTVPPLAEGADGYTTTTPNNDEFRDAFCRSVDVELGYGKTNSIQQNVYLYRPLAQINVGTNGYDFESITRNAKKKYLYSKIRVNRVARYLDVVKDKTYGSTTNDDPYGENPEVDEDGNVVNDHKTTESFAVADFGYAPFPAYVNFQDKDDKKNLKNTYTLPTYPSYTIWDWYYEDFNDGDKPNDGNYGKSDYEKEEFLKVHLYDSDMRGTAGYTDDQFPIVDTGEEGNTTDGYLDYASLTQFNKQNVTDLRSETFKYLSMCYVLTSSTKDDPITINNVKVWLATDPTGADSIEVVNLNNVPAQRNWRTNIIGNLLTEEQTFSVSLDKDFAGEYNWWSNGDSWEHSGPLADGVYYDAANDEIQISNVNGLLWFQRMVNGTLKVRDENGVNTAQDYPYYGEGSTQENSIDKVLKYNGISPDDMDEALRKRILKATHQDMNDNSKQETNGWPKNNNFHFCGSNGPAKVKLMADIDLDGIEWIPIGYDFKVHDTSVDISSNNLDFKESDGTQRAFCGIFDGNNHTISNLTTKRYTAKVHDKTMQTSSKGPYDDVHWFPAGFFGMVGGSVSAAEVEAAEKNNAEILYTKISNLRLFNPTIFGYHCAAGIAAIVNSKDSRIDITNCIVDGGSIDLSPMFRGDDYKNKIDQTNTERKNLRNRTFARGIYLGGIVGQYVANGNITGCEVRNVNMRGYRQIGGLVGSVSNQEQIRSNKGFGEDKNLKVSIKDNIIANLLLIADKFQPYDSICSRVLNPADNSEWQNGFGWVASQKSLANPYVGGTETEEYTNNSGNNTIQFAEFNTGTTTTTTSRKATIDNVPLKYIPMLSSWFCDEVNLKGNYYGETKVRTRRGYYEFSPYTIYDINGTKIRVPFDLPYSLSMDYLEAGKPAAMYVESVTLNGAKGLGGRSVITPTGLNGEGACVMFVTSRDRKQFFEDAGYVYFPDNSYKNGYKEKKAYRKPTIIKNVVLRGDPYAWTGMLFSPNENMDYVELDSVTIYDVYQTLALDANATTDNTGGTSWPTDEKDGIPLIVNESNLRGYTVPGKGWQSITFEHTTFGQGAYIKNIYGKANGNPEQAYTYKAEAPATFIHCYFKAPYVIDMTGLQEGEILEFKENDESKGKKGCYATSSSTENVLITTVTDRPIGVESNAKIEKIRITSNVQGDPVVIYYFKDHKIGYVHDSDGWTGETYDATGETKQN